MCGQELATAAQYGAKVIFIVVNNGMYGTIRMHQEREYPARVYGTALANPDFVQLARAYGAHGELVEETSQFAAAFERALDATEASDKPALIELRIDPQAITPNTTLDALRQQALKRSLKRRGRPDGKDARAAAQVESVLPNLLSIERILLFRRPLFPAR